MGDKQTISKLAYTPNYGKEPKWSKIKRKVRDRIVNRIYGTPLQFKAYASYWHYRFSPKGSVGPVENQYLGQKPNFGAGIGHQMANWNTGLYFAGVYKKKLAHYSFSTLKWESFLGFGEGEVMAEALEKDKNYKVVRLPKFDSSTDGQIDLVGKIIASYKRPNVLFALELDQGYTNQYDTTKILSDKFFNAEARKNDKFIFAPGSLNIAVHIRRRMSIEGDEVWKSRGLDNTYFSNILRQVLDTIKTDKKIDIYLFSQGKLEEFPEFKTFENMHYCMDMGPVDSFLHMVYADILISSKSSFSYKPALISKGIKICPSSFWHGYPPTDDFILADNDSNFDVSKLSTIK